MPLSFANIPSIPGYIPDVPAERLVRTFDSLGQLVDLCEALWEQAKKDAHKEGVEKDEYEVYFRGDAAFFSRLEPKLYRNPGVRYENDLFQAALSSVPDYFNTLPSTFDKLTRLRHYDFGVRLLDLSPNVLPALFMALDGWCSTFGNHLDTKTAHDATAFYPCPRITAVRVPRGRVKTADSDLVTVLSCLAKVKDEFTISQWWHEIKQERNDFNEEYFWEHFEDYFENWFVDPRLNNPRVAMQQGKFVLMGLSRWALRGTPMGRVLYNPHFVLKKSAGPSLYYPLISTKQERLPNPPISVECYLIPSEKFLDGTKMAESIQGALMKLSRLGIAENTIYPDDLVRHSHFLSMTCKRWSEQSL